MSESAAQSKVLFNDFRAEPEALLQAELRAVERVMRSGWYILGAEVERFEAAWAGYCGVAHAVGFGNGMDAIEAGLRASGIGPGDEVITTSMTAFATVLAVLRAGATPVLADIDPTTGLLEPASVERCISPRTRGVLLVHLYGQIRDIDVWQALCRTHGILLFEDCAQAHGARWQGRVAGTFGEWGAYSFYPTKNLGARGDAGALICNSADIAAKVRQLRNYGQSQRYHHPVLGMNSRLDEIHAAMLTERLAWLDDFTAQRRAVASAYREAMVDRPGVELLAPPHAPENHAEHLFVVKCRERDSAMRAMSKAGVQTLIHYPVPVHLQEPCADVKRDPAGLAHAEHFAAQCLSLPCRPGMTATQVAWVATTAVCAGNDE